MKVALAQVSATDDHGLNLRKAIGLMEEACRSDARVICFPEMAFRMFFPQYRCERRFFEWAEPVPGPTTEIFQQKAEELGLVTIINLFEKSGPA